ncbi:MAG TPA: ROK family protein, partial [Dehalococcoidia bacterium]|nr:ROK family protein [Dehalococcoidia bacterium]
MPDLYGALDLGGTKLRAVVADLGGNISGEIIRPSEANDGPELVIARMIETLEAACAEAGVEVSRLAAVGVASPGALDLVRGLVFEAPQLPGWDGVPLIEIMSERLGIPALLENDANAAALGENRFGAGRGTRFMVYLTISTGVGGGIIIDGKVYHGLSGAAGELGHMIVWFNGPRCLCGERGCLEAIASGTGLAWRARDLVEAGEAAGLARVLREKGELDADEIADAARAGDEDARRLFDEAGLYLGIALSNYVNIFNPEIIVLGGGVLTGAGDLFFEHAERIMRQLARKEPLKYVRLERATLGDRSGPLGMI